ncbi:RNA polymerase sigma factor [Edaphobacter dinghuensis]|uniref:RNA polymerase subunit sigma-24 n=1 Tax=Edaphobacter dinghuensis TaxID=1560005 RepID=A0A917LZL0_9BACT|nr:RNA polymerase sigma factor [Edaphobacter dinghuensis]GGG67166.1 RNA polymerase subunit sigma-24 [Edaphobacter dinghuensis]
MSDIHRTIEAVWRIESTRLITGIARVIRDVGIAEELAQEALVAALEQWPEEGIPDNPAAWLMTAAKRRAIDQLRRGRMLELKHGEIARELELEQRRLGDALDQSLDQVIDDDVLRLIFIACHPVLAVEGCIALTLRLICGLTTAEIARAFLVPEKTLGQRIFRAKRTLAEAHVRFESPRGEELRRRVETVLSVVYLIFNEGYTATSGGEWMRAALSEEALRLGRMLAQLLPAEPEIHGLLALMELQASRAAARTGPDGAPVLLLEQNRSLWDYAQIQRGMAALERAQGLGGGAGNYAMQAAIAACHARARTASETDWERIVLLYDALLQIRPSPIVALNRAVAVGMAYPAAGLDAVDALANEPGLANYHLLPTVRGDLLIKLGRFAEARKELQRALGMTQNEAEQILLRKKLQMMDEKGF